MPDAPKTEKPLRITFVMPHVGLEGGTRVCAIYAERLAAKGHHVSVVSCGRRARPHPLKYRIKCRVLDFLRHGLRPAPARPTHFDALPHLHRRLDTAGPITADDVPDADVVVATWWETAYWVADYPASKGAKVHFIQHDERIMARDDNERRRTGEVWRLPDFERVVVAEWLGDLGRREFGADATLVGNAVDTTMFDAPPRGRGRPFTVSMMYSLAPFKAVEVATRAVEIARKSVPDLRVTAFGEREAAVELPLPAGTIYARHPSPAALRDLYAGSDAYLFASRCEGFGLPILEAMACRTPVVATRTGAAPELVGEGGGRLADVEDADALAAGIVELATSPEEAWRAASDVAYATARRHDWATAAGQFEAVLHKVARSHGTGSR